MKGLVLFLTSLILMAIFYPIGFCYSILLTLLKNGYAELDGHLYKCAVANDQHGNTFLAKIFNDWLIKPGGHKFGNPDETISSVLGKNQLRNKLSLPGRMLNWLLDKIEKDHSIKSIE